MADGATKSIDQIKVGDQIADVVPGQSGTQSNTVTAVIATKTDHDFVNVGITPSPPPALRSQPTPPHLQPTAPKLRPLTPQPPPPA